MGEESVPIYLETNAVGTPFKNGSVQAYLYAQHLCWFLGAAPKSQVISFPVEIPPNATYAGDVTIRGQKCTEWKLDDATIAVRSDGTIARFAYGNIPFINSVYWDFFNTVKGAVNPRV